MHTERNNRSGLKERTKPTQGMPLLSSSTARLQRPSLVLALHGRVAGCARHKERTATAASPRTVVGWACACRHRHLAPAPRRSISQVQDGARAADDPMPLLAAPPAHELCGRKSETTPPSLAARKIVPPVTWPLSSLIGPVVSKTEPTHETRTEMPAPPQSSAVSKASCCCVASPGSAPPPAGQGQQCEGHDQTGQDIGESAPPRGR